MIGALSRGLAAATPATALGRELFIALRAAPPEKLAEITAATRVMVGECEMPGFLAFSKEAAEGIPGATLEVVPDCGHLLPLEAPDAVAKMIIGLF